MSGIIKSGNLADLSTVRSIAALPAAAAPISISRQDEERERLNRCIATLEDDVRKREEAMAALRLDVERAFQTGKEEGRKEGLAEAEDRQSERLSLLNDATSAALEKLSEYLSSLERLAPLLARDCLDKILGNADDRVEFVRRIIAEQIGKIEKTMLLGIEVSRHDFSDAKAMAALKRMVGLTTVVLTANDDAPSGACVMTLRLGRINVGIGQQWSALREMLEEMSLPEAAE